MLRPLCVYKTPCGQEKVSSTTTIPYCTVLYCTLSCDYTRPNQLDCLQDSVQDAANFNYSPSIRATAQKCLLHSLDEDPTSVLPAQAVIELSEDIENIPLDPDTDTQSTEETPQEEEQEELPTSTSASTDQPNPESQQGSEVLNIAPREDEDEQPAADGADSDSDPIPISSTAADSSSKLSSINVAPAVAHAESAVAKIYQQQQQHTQDKLLDSAMDMRPVQTTDQAETPETVSNETVSDAAMSAASHAVASNGVQERGVRTAAAAAAAALAPEVDDVMWPALMRQEAEGGVLLIQALKRSLQSGR